MHLVTIALAGGLGALARYSLTGFTHRLTAWDFPVGTLLVNVVGCFVFGFLTPLLAERAHIPEAWRMGVIIGFLGSFTTFSTFGFDTIDLAQNGDWGKAALNVFASLLLGCCGVLAGLWLAGRVEG
jgi:CrcB protein